MVDVQEEDVVVAKKEGRELTLNDRCDSCNAASYVKVTGVTGDLLFCGHHYNKIMNNPDSQEKMIAFAFDVLDERDYLLGENRLKSDD